MSKKNEDEDEDEEKEALLTSALLVAGVIVDTTVCHLSRRKCICSLSDTVMLQHREGDILICTRAFSNLQNM